MSNEPEALELPGLVRDLAREGARKAQATKARKRAEAEITSELPVARVLLDLPGAHLDGLYDYSVPSAMAEAAQPGVRVKAKFGSSEYDGFLIARTETTDHVGQLTPLRRVVGNEPVLDLSLVPVIEAVARHYGGAKADLLRFAVPPRHAATEAVPMRRVPPPEPDLFAAVAAWQGHVPGEAFLKHIRDGGAPSAVWHAAPGTDWPMLLAHAAAVALSARRGSVLCVADHKALARLDAALTSLLGPGQHVMLSADQGPAARYQSFLAARRGIAPIVIGTRTSVWAPVHNLGLIVLWDDGDESLADPRTPYPHAREVARLRASAAGAGLLVGGFAPSAEARTWVGAGTAREIAPDRAMARARLTVTVPGASDIALERDPLAHASRIPREAYDLIRTQVQLAPVLVQVPRRGYLESLACETCRTPARCAACSGPLRLGGPTEPPHCRWCGESVPTWQCRICGGMGLRAPVLGADRTAEELGRSFPGIRVVSSSGERMIATVSAAPAIVVATPGAEPVAAGGYAGVVLLDSWLALGWPGLRSDEDALRRFSNALGLAGPGGRGVITGDPAHPVLQALVRWDQPGYLDRELAERAEAHLPPAARIAVISGGAGALQDALTVLALPEHTEVLGPVPEGDEWRAVIRTPASNGEALAASIGELARVRSARRLDPVRIQIDPPTL